MEIKSTGIVRRIDDLGRVVIPKEIRRQHNIDEGDPLELFVYGDYLCLKKYSTKPELLEKMDSLLVTLEDTDLFKGVPSEKVAVIKAFADVLNASIIEVFSDAD